MHKQGFATRGSGAICMEASAVVPEGRITPQDNGIWSDEHIPGLKRIVDFAHAQGTAIGIQLAHAGRKASTRAPWAQTNLKGVNRDPTGSDVATKEELGWPDEGMIINLRRKHWMPIYSSSRGAFRDSLQRPLPKAQ